MTGTLMEPALLSDREVYFRNVPRRSESLSDRELQWAAARSLEVLLAEIPGSPPSMYIAIRESEVGDPLLELEEVSSQGTPQWLPRLAMRAAELLMLPEGWDTYGAVRIERGAIECGLRLLLLVSSSHTPAPSLIPLPDGRLQIEWHTGATDLEIEVAENGMLRAYCHGSRAEDEWESDFDPAVTRLEEIVSRLS